MADIAAKNEPRNNWRNITKQNNSKVISYKQTRFVSNYKLYLLLISFLASSTVTLSQSAAVAEGSSTL